MLKGVRAYFLFAATIFLSAFLLFLIQPIAGKLLLPWFGGSSSVWATSMLFFTGVLFLGYCYAYWLTRRHIKEQVRIHIIVTALGVLAALVSLAVWGSIYPSLEWTIGSSLPPALKTLAALVTGLGIPYFLLSTTGPLLQYWYGVSAGKEPYKLYAISNAGSLLALAAYPFLIEPVALLSEQEMVWSILFLIFAALLVRVSRGMRRENIPTSHGREKIPYRRAALWIAYAALPAFMLVATTTEITQTIAPLPLLWIAPLSLYLLSFIIAFTGFRGWIIVPAALFASAYAAWHYIDVTSYGIRWRILADVSLLFFLALHAHSHLYRLRPATAQSALFYVFVSFGGVVGTLLASVLPPLIFSDYYEFAIGVALAAAVAVHISPAPWPINSRAFHRVSLFLRTRGFKRTTALRSSPSSPTRGTDSGSPTPSALAHAQVFRKESVWIYILKMVIISFVLTLVALGLRDYFKERNASYAEVSRNFYGTVKVYVGPNYRSLLHGTTMHGMQMTDPALEFVPLAYYSPDSGIGRSFMHARLTSPDARIRVAVLGLGAGMTASYCTPGDEFVYYEIDPRIEGVAREYFTYLSKCPQAEIRLGDGRILLDQEFREGLKGNYDVILADAFNDDTIPVHLMTREAIHRYVSHLKDENGIVGIHISNRYLDMLPVVMAIAQEEGLSLLDVRVNNDDLYGSTSHWVLLSPSPETFTADIFKGAASQLSQKKVRAWTDSYSNLLSVIELP